MILFLSILAIAATAAGIIAWWDAKKDDQLNSRGDIKYPRSWENDDWFGM